MTAGPRLPATRCPTISRRIGPPGVDTASRLLLLILVAGCAGNRPAAVVSPPDTTPAVSSRPRATWSLADVRFMHDMIAHHGQALVMTALVPVRTARADLRLLAERIALSQQDEIERMRRWLQARGEAVPEAAAGHRHDGMPGMLTAAELVSLEQAHGGAFEQLFLQLMIRHHEGALTMVSQLAATPGAGGEPELYRLVNDIDADQRAEIARMRRLLAAARS